MADGANHYRLLGLEITRPASKGTVVQSGRQPVGRAPSTTLFSIACGFTDAQDETNPGAHAHGQHYVAVVDSPSAISTALP